MSAECSSYQSRNSVCKDGFVQVPNCRRPELCKCGQSYAGAVPPCLKDEIPAHLSKDDGTPLFWRER